MNINNETPLLYASRRSKPALIRLLLERGADRTIKDNYGDTAEDHADNEPTKRAFLTQQVDQTGKLPYKLLLYIFQYLNAKDVCKAACVCGKWHRVSENPVIWSNLGIRRWELSLKSSLGFTTAAINLSYRPSNNRRPSKEKNNIVNDNSTHSLAYLLTHSYTYSLASRKEVILQIYCMVMLCTNYVHLSTLYFYLYALQYSMNHSF